MSAKNLKVVFFAPQDWGGFACQPFSGDLFAWSPTRGKYLVPSRDTQGIVKNPGYFLVSPDRETEKSFQVSVIADLLGPSEWGWIQEPDGGTMKIALVRAPELPVSGHWRNTDVPPEQVRWASYQELAAEAGEHDTRGYGNMERAKARYLAPPPQAALEAIYADPAFLDAWRSYHVLQSSSFQELLSQGGEVVAVRARYVTVRLPSGLRREFGYLEVQEHLPMFVDYSSWEAYGRMKEEITLRSCYKNIISEDTFTVSREQLVDTPNSSAALAAVEEEILRREIQRAQEAKEAARLEAEKLEAEEAARLEAEEVLQRERAAAEEKILRSTEHVETFRKEEFRLLSVTGAVLLRHEQGRRGTDIVAMKISGNPEDVAIRWLERERRGGWEMVTYRPFVWQKDVRCFTFRREFSQVAPEEAAGMRPEPSATPAPAFIPPPPQVVVDDEEPVVPIIRRSGRGWGGGWNDPPAPPPTPIPVAEVRFEHISRNRDFRCTAPGCVATLRITAGEKDRYLAGERISGLQCASGHPGFAQQ